MKFFLLIILLVQISFGQNHFNTLKKEEAKKAILDESMEPFFSILQPLEIAAMTDEEVSDMPIDKLRVKTKKDFQSFVMDFNDAENKLLKEMCEVVDNKLAKDFPLLKSIPWHILKVSTKCCSGFPHTRNKYTIMTERVLKNLPKDLKPDSFRYQRICSILLHEKIHVAQRFHPEKFRKIYKELWNFDHLGKIETPAQYVKMQASNPDALDYGFAIKLDLNPNDQTPAQWLWPRTFMNPNKKKPRLGYDFMPMFLQIEQKDKKWQVIPDSKPINFFQQEYMKKFPVYGVSRGMDHPNEIMAYSMEQVMGYNLSNNTEEDNKKISTIRKLMKKYMKK